MISVYRQVYTYLYNTYTYRYISIRIYNIDMRVRERERERERDTEIEIGRVDMRGQRETEAMFVGRLQRWRSGGRLASPAVLRAMS